MKFSIQMLLRSIKGSLVLSVIFLLSMSACTSVKGYQKAYLNDSEMALSDRKVERFETYFQFYREASAGANGGKTGGGCGCN